MAGQGTAALELLEDVPSLDALLAPIGGGGLLAGCSTVARTLFPGMQVFGVEPDTANDTYLSMAGGERVTIAPPSTIADGLRAVTPGALTFPVLRANLAGVLLVSDDEVRAAVRYLALRAHIVLEPSGAVAAAAVLSGRLPIPRGLARGRDPLRGQHRPGAADRHPALGLSGLGWAARGRGAPLSGDERRE